jgi:hypothetical protein
MRVWKAAAVALLLITSPGAAQPPAFDPQPWIEDLAELRIALETKYANLEWLRSEREVDLPSLFDRAAPLLRDAGSEAEAVRLFNRIIQRIGDGHVEIRWPRPTAPTPTGSTAAPAAPTVEGFCGSIGYDFNPPSPGIAPAVQGYAALDGSNVFPSGSTTIGNARAGLLRIHKFDPHIGSLCARVLAELRIAIDRPCDSECEDKILTHAYRSLTLGLEDQLTRLKASGAEILIVDITGNGGGSEWVEAAARMLTPRTLTSARTGFVRGAHWVGNWTRTRDKLREYARSAAPGTAGAFSPGPPRPTPPGPRPGGPARPAVMKPARASAARAIRRAWSATPAPAISRARNGRPGSSALLNIPSARAPGTAR